MTPRAHRPPSPFSRRTALLAGVLAPTGALSIGGSIAGCTGGQEGPDPLLALADAAHTDAEQARAIFASYPELTGAKVVAKARAEQAKALRKEVNREAGESSTAKRPAAKPRVPGDSSSAGKRLSQALRDAQQEAAELVPTLPRYRAGLVGSVSAGCATLLEALS